MTMPVVTVRVDLERDEVQASDLTLDKITSKFDETRDAAIYFEFHDTTVDNAINQAEAQVHEQLDALGADNTKYIADGGRSWTQPLADVTR